MDIIFSVAMLL